jgi:hypothetical protein
MATHDYIIDNGTGAAVRADLNNALAAIVSNNSNSSEPATKYAYQWWADLSNNVMKIRNSANDGWIELFQLDGTITLEDGSASTPALAFRDDLDTGIFSGGANQFNIATGGTERFIIDSSGRVLIGTTTEGHASADDLTVNNSGNGGITIRTGTTSNGAIFFSDATSGDAEFDGFVQYNHGTDPLMQFGVGGGTKMAIKGDSVGIGTNSPSGSLHVNAASSVDGPVFDSGGTNNTNHAFLVRDSANNQLVRVNNNGKVGIANSSPSEILHVTGNILASGTITPNSDIVFKKDVEPLQNALSKITQLLGINFTYKDNNEKSMGLVAQDVEKVYPELIRGEEGNKSLNYMGLTGAIVEAIKELSDKVAALEAA